MSIKHALTIGAVFVGAGAIATGAEATGAKVHVTPNVDISNSAAMAAAKAAHGAQQAVSGPNASNNVTTYQINPRYPQTTYDKNNVAICPASIQAADRKELSKATLSSEQIFSRIACGQLESVGAMLTFANKADPIDLLLGPKKEAFALCMENSIPKSLSVTTYDGVKVEPIDLNDLDKEDRTVLIGTLAYACKYELGLK